tara:strand:- start:213 stop:374 length:162 start_codon:yes stop_codon:yes gene_type:complete
MINDLKKMEKEMSKDLDKLMDACKRLVDSTKDIPSIEDQIKQIVKIQGGQLNE